MKKALLLVSSHSGHYNATYHFSKCLQLLNYDVSYAGDNKFKDQVETAGFKFESLFFNEAFFDYTRFTLKIFSSTLLENALTFIKRNRYKRFKAAVSMLEDVVKAHAYDLIFIDSFLHLHPLLLHRYKDKIILLETMLSRLATPDIEPLNCDRQQLRSSVIRSICIKMKWRLHFFNIRFQRLLKSVAYLNQSNMDMAHRYLNENGFKSAIQWHKKRSFFYSLDHLKEIVLSPAELDYPWKVRVSNQFHLSSERDLFRLDTGIDEEYKNIVGLLQVRKQNNVKVIYCSLGSIAAIHHQDPYIFLKKVRDAYSYIEDRVLIISTGDQITKDKLRTEAPNVFVLTKVPQGDILRYADLLISHGGLNSMIESILTETPILTFPLNRRWDHVGNAARAVYHKIGLSGNIRNTEKEEIFRSAESILTDIHFKKNVSILRESFKTSIESLSSLQAFLLADVQKVSKNN